ncbi:hypothetical protein, partial [Pontimicrobium sp. MEBiC01747]
MRQRIILYLVFLLSIHLSFAQSENLDISFNNTTLKDAIIQLEQKSNRPFYFIENWFEGITITKSYKNK